MASTHTQSGLERLRLEYQGYTPFPKQVAFHKSGARYRLFGGAAGPGKSIALIMEGVKFAGEMYDKVSVLILRRTFEELEGSIILNFHRQVPRELYKSYSTQKHRVEFHNGSILKFGYCKHENDIWQYQGHEYILVLWDELTQFTLSQWQTMKGWNRSPYGPGKMAGATNPVGVGWKWVKQLWIDREPADGMDENEKRRYQPADHHYIPANYTDNPIYAKDKSYIAALEALPTHLKEALMAGRWDVRAGSYFDIFDPATMCGRPELWEIQPWWPKWISIDWGFNHPAAVYWHTRDGHVTYTYRELIARKTKPGDLAEMICKRSLARHGEQEKVEAVYLSPDAFWDRSGGGTIADQMHEAFRAKGFPTVAQADNDRVGGAMLMYSLLSDGLWKIGTNCTKLIECLPMMQRDERNVEDVAKMDGDDPYEGARYGLKSRLSPKRTPVMQRIRAEITAEDKNAQAMQIRRALAEEEKKVQPRRLRYRRRRRRTW